MSKVSNTLLPEMLFDTQKFYRLIILLSAFIAVDYFFLKDRLFNISLEHQILMRTDYYSHNLELFLHVISEVSDAYGVAFFVGFGFCILTT